MNAGIRNPVLRFVVYSHLWLALGAAAQTWWMGEMLWTGQWRSSVVAFCGTIVCYTYMRWVRMDHPELAGSPHLKWFRENRRSMLAMAGVAAVTAAWVSAPFAGELLRRLWPVALIAAAYVLPLRATGGRTAGLRRIPLLKALLIAFAWAAVTVGLPFVQLDAFEEKGWWSFVMQFAFFLSLAIAFDVRDLPFDVKSLRTLPQLLGATGAKFFAVLFQLPWMLFLVTMAFFSLSPIEEVTPRGYLLGPMLLPFAGHVIACVMIARATPDCSEAYFSVGLDGMLILIPLLGWIGSLL